MSPEEKSRPSADEKLLFDESFFEDDDIGYPEFDGNFDYAVMAQSPNYTPASADFILDIFREYIEEI